jgi:hypothetical protein
VKQKLKTTFIFLLIAASLGLTLRFIQAGILPGHFKHLMHTHSHIALLGWLYNASVIILQYSVFKRKDSGFNPLFWVSQITFVGMMFSFPFQGYAFASITFSTLYLFTSYYLVYLLFKESIWIENPYVVKFVKWAGIYLVLSSFGPFSLGFIMAKGLQDTFWYNLSIYWFLHFLYNGFFVFVIFGYWLNRLNSHVNQKAIFWLMNLSVIPIYFLSTLWLEPDLPVYLVALVGSLFQFLAFVLLLKGKKIMGLFKHPWALMVWLITMGVYALKMIFQIFSVHPEIQEFLSQTVSFSIIGFIHLVMLGFFTLLTLIIFTEEKFITISSTFKIGIILLVSGIALSEVLLFGQSISVYYNLSWISNFFMTLSLASALMPIGIALITWSVFWKN